MACPRPLGKSCGFSSGKYRFGMFRNEPTPQPINKTLNEQDKKATYSFPLSIYS
jgi:hypothetical protein